VTQAAEDAPLRHPRLEIRRVLGAGGMGVVHAAYDPVLEREVAVKVIRVTGAASGARARILREARAIARISHPNVVHVYSADAFDDQVAIVMELVQGQTLRQWLADRPRTWQEILAVFVEAGRGLAAAHDAGLVHRDFKPDNVMVRTDGRACVLDFGLARALEAQTADGATVPLTPETARAISAEATVTLEASGAIDHASPDAAPSRVTATGALVGTPLYMAPEQHLGAPTDARADQFAFCVALYRALFGQHPFDDTTYATLVTSVVTGEYRAPARKRAPPYVTAALRRGLSVDPEQRFPGMHALLASIALDAAGQRHRRWAGIGGVLAIAALITARVVADRAPSRPRAQPTAEYRPTTPRRVSTTGDVRWVKPSHDGRRLLLGNTRGEFLVRDLAEQDADRHLRVEIPRTTCDVSWSWANDAVIVTGTDRAYIHRVRAEVPPVEIPLRGCVAFVGETEVVAHVTPRDPLTFLNLVSRSSRSCPIPGDDAWVIGVDARPDIDRLLLTTLDDRTNRQHIWSMNRDCSDARLVGSIPHPVLDDLRPVGAVVGRWGRSATEVLTAIPVYSPPGASLLSTSTHLPDLAASIMSLPSVGQFSLTRTGTLYATQHHQSTQLWMKNRSGSFTRLSRDSAARDLGSFTPDGRGVYVIEESRSGRMVRTASFSGGDPITLSEHDETGVIPFEVGASRSGVLAVRGVQNHSPVIAVQSAEGTLEPMQFAADLGATDMEWVGDTLLLNTPGNRNFAVIDGGRRREKDLLADPSLGWALHPLGAPDGDTVALYLNRNGMELWTVRVSTGEETRLGPKLFPVGWSADSRWIYATEVGGDDVDVRVVRVPAKGGAPEPWLRLPGFSRSYEVKANTNGDVLIMYRTTQLDAYAMTLPAAPARDD
jgi:hypothetical protein